MVEMRRALIRSEDDIKKKLAAQKTGVDAGIWVEQMISSANLTSASSVTANVDAAPGAPQVTGAMSASLRAYMMGGRAAASTTPAPAAPTVDASAVVTAASTTNTITLICRAVSLNSVDSSANTEIAYAVETEIKNSPLVDPKATQLSANISADDPNGTFTFTVNVALRNPLSF
jgi:hypothetical protein